MERELPWYVFATLIAPIVLVIGLSVVACIECCRPEKVEYGDGGEDDDDGYNALQEGAGEYQPIAQPRMNYGGADRGV
jgi:hypothetical protein